MTEREIENRFKNKLLIFIFFIQKIVKLLVFFCGITYNYIILRGQEISYGIKI